MLRRVFLYHSTLSIAGLFTAQSVFAKGTMPILKRDEKVEKIALLKPEKAGSEERKALTGAIRILQESRLTFDLINHQEDYSSYAVLVLPDVIRLTEKSAQKVDAFVHQGGSVLASYQSGLATDGTNFSSDLFGLRLIGEAPYSPDFILVPSGPINQNLTETDLPMYLRGMQVQPTAATVLAQAGVLGLPFSTDQVRDYPAITRHKRALYFCHPVFTQYAHSASPWCKRLVVNVLNTLLAERVATKIAVAKQA